MATRSTSTKEAVNESTAGPKAAGVALGATEGAVVGALVAGPLGAAVGAVAGGAMGTAVDSYESAEPEFVRHYEKGPYRSISKWEEVRPAYRYGFESYDRPEWSGRPYDEVQTHLKKGWTGGGKYEDFEPMVRKAWEHRATATLDGGGEAVVPVVEEELRVGKRKVQKGGVRVETTVTERPVEEHVNLHEETIKVERRPANRSAKAGDVAFKEGAIELTETAEEVVVDKRARVIEEVVIKKQGRNKTETVRDTVRKTDVKVEKTNSPARTVSESTVKDFSSYDGAFRKDYQSRLASGGRSYDEVMPAYRYGYSLAGDGRYSGDWDEVESDARKHWEVKNKGTWDEFKDAIRHSWETVTGRH